MLEFRKMVNTELNEFKDIAKKIAEGERVEHLDKKVAQLFNKNPAFLAQEGCYHLLPIIINENRKLHGRPVPKPYADSRKAHLKTLQESIEIIESKEMLERQYGFL